MINKRIFQTIIDTIPNPTIITNGRKAEKCNKSFLEYFSYSSLGKFVKEHTCVCNLFIQDKDYFSLGLLADGILWTDYIYNNPDNNTMVSIFNKDKVPNIFEVTINKLPEYDDYYIVVFTNITATQNEKKLLEKMAYNDPLTNIYNRQMFRKLYLKELENKKRYCDELSLIMFDIDHFKIVNDTYGHDIGDKVLIALTQLVSKHLRTNDIFARWGGEEFLILLPRTDKATSYDKAQELRKRIEEYQGKIPHITVSFGVTDIREYDKDESAFIRVDQALYQAKIKRNDVVQL